jgi:uncharacterized membrane protein
MTRPKIKIKSEPIDRIVESIGVIGIILLIGLPVFYYSSLPDIIPRYYGSSGEPDGFSGKGIIWTLPAIGLVMYVGMAMLNKFPHIFNYLIEITTENAERQYKIATKLLRFLNTIIACVFCYITYATIQTALGKQSGLGSYFTPIFMVLIFGIIGIYLYKSIREK